MKSVDWSARPDQIENLALREVGVSVLPKFLRIKAKRVAEICPDS
jgi:hypothetical protein